MTVYRGIVKDNVIVLPEEVNPQDGTEIQVMVVPPTVHEPGSAETLDVAEEAFEQRLPEKGLILEIKHPSPTAPEGDCRPIKVKGKPMSQMIIEDRR